MTVNIAKKEEKRRIVRANSSSPEQRRVSGAALSGVEVGMSMQTALRPNIAKKNNKNY